MTTTTTKMVGPNSIKSKTSANKGDNSKENKRTKKIIIVENTNNKKVTTTALSNTAKTLTTTFSKCEFFMLAALMKTRNV